MPLYDYQCDRCGPFRAWRGMNEAGEAVPCPTCIAPAERAVGFPMLAILPRNNRIAHERNERSAHEPMVKHREELPPAGGHAHPLDPRIERQFGHVHQSHSHRKWMVGH